MDRADAATLLIELAEKMGLLAAAALVAVLIPPLRNRLLGVGRRRDKLAAVALGLVLAAWGAMLGFHVGGEHINVRAIGVLIAAILGGWKAGALAGLGGGLFYAALVDPETAPWVLAASITDGVLAGLVAERRPTWFQGWRVFVSSIGIQAIHLVVVGVGLLAVGHAARYIPAWPAHLVKLVVVASGVTLFVTVARLVVSREEQAVALVEARAAADAAALESLRRRLEPHFLFNALNVLRATIRRDPGRARELVSDLADLYRYLLSHPDQATLSEEMEHAQAYLAIERARLGDERLAVAVELPPALARLTVPPLLLQPLVENAVKHGIGRRDGPGRVQLRARADDDALVIEVEDAAHGRRLPPVESGSGIALSTLRRRLARRYGDAASLELRPTDEGMRAVVRLPLEEGQLLPDRRAA
ncbi:MAG TPA: histidine kinase [Sandaracinaceae bacterium LLY-WYZ-13_1]|nr:histidine kinase [Sandaracinaceae bacterium LLY-WYZ-13_1]